EAEVRFRLIAEAYQVLSDPDKRQLYDIAGPEAFAEISSGRSQKQHHQHQHQHHSQQHYQQHYNHHNTTRTRFHGFPFSPFQFHDPFEIFNDFFRNDPFF